ncbi:alanine dehydrogenase [Polynucleobacter sp. Latsch14-2]|jgi:alanine dehydrogenase|uniref:alanine dehydrogenase n=1 Tax=Polynucleobacter sp. Latsch14-2 TaxID=2576920 RepID=UPI001C0C21E7|nr:alanine dehydrogenase [Polynucleobacter sp. Latsch14-2]MBU3614442.1 alanine dehydrogenase [Polynucleobacter sp. Latsch14-2]
MIIGVPQEVKNNEFRVGLTPGNVRGLCKQGHSVLVQRGAGAQIGLSDESYRIAGATLINSAAEVYSKSEMIVKVKEPQPQECAMLREEQILFTYLHLAPDPAQTQALINSGASCIAYETVTSMNGALPLLAPMSEVAGRMSIQAAASHLEKTHGGLGVLMAGVPGVAPAKVVILGGGVVGRNALQMAVGIGADVCIFDRDIERLRQIDALYGNRVRTFYSDPLLVEREVCTADAVIGAVLLPGAAAPKLVTHDMVRKMQPGSVVVDVAIDQGGCFETSKPTIHADPTFLVDGVIHYCVANMPGAVARTSTFALTNATYPFVEVLANRGVIKALSINHHLRNGLSVHRGMLTSEPVAQAQRLDFVSAEELLTA